MVVLFTIQGGIHIDWIHRNPKPIAQIEDELERAKKAHDDFVNSWFDLSDLAQVRFFFSFQKRDGPRLMWIAGNVQCAFRSW